MQKKATFSHNCKLSKGGWFKTVRICRKDQIENNASGVRACRYCGEFYAKDSVAKHLRICGSVDGTTGKHLKHFHNLKLGDIYPNARVYLRVVVSRLSHDKISRVAKRDKLIVEYGNNEAYKYRDSKHRKRQIRGELGLLARIVLAMKAKCPDVTDLTNRFLNRGSFTLMGMNGGISLVEVIDPRHDCTRGYYDKFVEFKRDGKDTITNISAIFNLSVSALIQPRCPSNIVN